MTNRKPSAQPQWLRALAGLAAVSTLASCATGIEYTALPARIDYVCSNNQILAVARAPDQRAAAVLVDGREVVLTRAASAAEEKYSDGRYSLYLDGERAMLEEQGRVVYGPCVSPVPLPRVYR